MLDFLSIGIAIKYFCILPSQNTSFDILIFSVTLFHLALPTFCFVGDIPYNESNHGVASRDDDCWDDKNEDKKYGKIDL